MKSIKNNIAGKYGILICLLSTILEISQKEEDDQKIV